MTATRDNDPEVQIAAADGLVNFYVPGYVQTGIAKFSSSIRSRFDRENKDIVEPWVTVRPEVIEALGKLARGAAQTWNPERMPRAPSASCEVRPRYLTLSRRFRQRTPQVLYEILIAFQKIGDPSAGPRAIQLLRDLEERVQIAAIDTVGLLRTREAIPICRRCLIQRNRIKVRRAALTSLAMLPDPQSRPYFDRGFKDKDDKLRAAAAEGYARLGNQADVQQLQHGLR